MCPVYDATIYLNQAEMMLQDQVKSQQKEIPQVTVCFCEFRVLGNCLLFFQLSKFHIDFGMRGGKVPLNTWVSDVVTITNQSRQKVKFDIAPDAPSPVQTRIRTSSAVLKRLILLLTFEGNIH